MDLSKQVFSFSLSSVIVGSLFCLPVYSGEKGDWNYGGTNNPTVWGEISEEYAACSNGKHQSPINLSESNTTQGTGEIEFNYKPIDLLVKNNGHTIQVDSTSDSYAIIDGEKYKLLQFHFHTPSEHTVEGKASALELHLVHQNKDGKLAVVGILIEEGNENAVLEDILVNARSLTAQKTFSEKKSLNVASLLPEDHSYYHYSGSLTTPPCTEGVSWNVMSTPIQASKQQIENFMEIHEYNSRPVQPLYDRTVEKRN